MTKQEVRRIAYLVETMADITDVSVKDILDSLEGLALSEEDIGEILIHLDLI